MTDRLKQSLTPSAQEVNASDTIDNADCETSAGSDSSVCGQRPIASFHTKVTLVISDYTSELCSSFPLPEMLAGTDDENFTFITEETGINIALQYNKEELELCLSA